MCMAVGKVSLEDCDMFTSSFGCTGDLEPRTPPLISIARLAMTSLVFMLLCVPLPVCQMCTGKCSSSWPLMTSSAAAEMSRTFSAVIRVGFNSALTMAQAFLSRPMARITGRGMTSLPMLKKWMLRAVCAPQ